LHKQEEFDLRALLFVTINDWPALSNILGQSDMGYNACTHCLDQTESIYLDKCRKNGYPYNRHFFPPKHPLKKKGKYFDGKAKTRSKPVPHTGAEVFDMLKDLKLIFEKGHGSQPVPNGVDKCAPLWKKKSIFW
jgi:hypothetical protein